MEIRLSLIFPAASASEVTTVWRYINWIIFIIIIIFHKVGGVKAIPQNWYK